MTSLVEVSSGVLFGSSTAILRDTVVDASGTILAVRADGRMGAHDRTGHGDGENESEGEDRGCEFHLELFWKVKGQLRFGMKENR